MDKIKLKVLGLSYSMTQSGAYALILSDEHDTRRIPIIIGMPEAQSIAIQIEKLQPHRPLTHDLVKQLSDKLDLSVVDAFIYKMENGIFYSELTFQHTEELIRLDSRTSDAVALALRFEAPIYTTYEIFNKVGIPVNPEVRSDADEKFHPEYTDYTEQELTRLMEEAVQNEDYEKASEFRDLLRAREHKE